jgi:myo-inositol catabolism protein IolC
MSLGYDKRLFLVAFDHRASFEQGLFGAIPPLSASVRDGIIKAKEIIFEATQLAVEGGAPRDLSGILVDEEFGTTVARRAKDLGVPLAMPAERSGQNEFDLQYGAAFGEHIESFDPTFVKVLVRYNPQGDADLNKRQTERLAILSEWLQGRHHKFLFELLIPPTAAQLNSLGGHQDDYDRNLRPKLVVEAIASLQSGGVSPDIWKIEGLEDSKDCTRVVDQARADRRNGVACIVLGRGADIAKVKQWIRTGAAVPGFSGFAVGRTLWHAALSDHLAGKLSALEAARTIANRYRTLINAYEGAETQQKTRISASSTSAPGRSRPT